MRNISSVLYKPFLVVSRPLSQVQGPFNRLSLYYDLYERLNNDKGRKSGSITRDREVKVQSASSRRRTARPGRTCMLLSFKCVYMIYIHYKLNPASYL